MPELPEVEVVRRGLERWATGRPVHTVEVRHPRAVRRHPGEAAEFSAAVTGRVFTAACRRGKYLWLPLAVEPPYGPLTDAGEAMVAHLGMSGQLLVVPPETPSGPHLRVRFAFADGGPDVRFVDQRTFGGLRVEPTDGGLPTTLAHIARDPFDPAFDRAATARALRSRRTGLKRALLDQSLVSGIGNIYADEALWRARLHYDRPADSLTQARAVELLGHAHDVMAAALAAGGTSFDSLYVDVNGRSGYFERSLEAYGRAGRPCTRCGTPIVREPFMNRSSFRCPRCQRVPRSAAAR